MGKIKATRIDYPNDVHRIKKILFWGGIDMSTKDCQKLWKIHSISVSAGWLFLPESDDLLLATLIEELIDYEKR